MRAIIEIVLVSLVAGGILGAVIALAVVTARALV